jgi:hypothetical protein
VDAVASNCAGAGVTHGGRGAAAANRVQVRAPVPGRLRKAIYFLISHSNYVTDPKPLGRAAAASAVGVGVYGPAIGVGWDRKLSVD